MDETCWNCGPVRSGKICATQIVVRLISKLASIMKGVWLPTVGGEGAIMSGLLPGGGNVISQRPLGLTFVLVTPRVMWLILRALLLSVQ